MAKIIDITEKLDFDTNPKIAIKGKEIEVNADAETVLKIMGEFCGVPRRAYDFERSRWAADRWFGHHPGWEHNEQP